MLFKCPELKAIKFNEKIIEVDLHQYKFFIEDKFKLYYVARMKLNNLLLSDAHISDCYKEIVINEKNKLRRGHIRDMGAMKAFGMLSQAASQDGALDKKTKELIALALGVASHCDGCIGFHTQALVKFGATKEEVVETLSMAIYMGGGPSLMYAADALTAFEQVKAI
jgi:AhpD family alkylhydroperoxidase